MDGSGMIFILVVTICPGSQKNLTGGKWPPKTTGFHLCFKSSLVHSNLAEVLLGRLTSHMMSVISQGGQILLLEDVA